LDMPVVALGGHMKATVAIGWGRRAVLSPHIGELDSPRAMGVFQRVVEDLQEIHKVEAKVLICDANPDYGSSRWARARGVPAAPVQHHIAHASALAGENPDIGRWLTFAWDGTGLGIHGSLWGGEAFLGAPGDWLRVASMRPFQLLGGDRAAREPWRCAAALMWEAGRDWTPPTPGASMAAAAWRKGVACTESSAVGRLFDAAAALVLGLETTSFEGQGPMMLEAIAEAGCDPVALSLARDANGLLRTDWAPLLDCFADDTMPAGERAGIFHASIAGALVAQVEAVAAEDKFDAVGLTGGVFQNRLLAETVAGLLDARDIQVVQHRIAPANDGGLAFGQLVEYACRMAGTSGGLRE
ncbi:MAG: carbamoyltransferase HypF, partial [Rhodobiaceae bacterium]|nr:carbamoyltransferase HypF [Rhodobiaceae bacterium]